LRNSFFNIINENNIARVSIPTELNSRGLWSTISIVDVARNFDRSLIGLLEVQNSLI